jgi:hypothetical protein
VFPDAMQGCYTMAANVFPGAMQGCYTMAANVFPGCDARLLHNGLKIILSFYFFPYFSLFFL